MMSVIKIGCLLVFYLWFFALALVNLFLFDLELSNKGLEFIRVFLVIFSDQFQAVLFVAKFLNRILSNQISSCSGPK